MRVPQVYTKAAGHGPFALLSYYICACAVAIHEPFIPGQACTGSYVTRNLLHQSHCSRHLAAHIAALSADRHHSGGARGAHMGTWPAFAGAEWRWHLRYVQAAGKLKAPERLAEDSAHDGVAPLRLLQHCLQICHGPQSSHAEARAMLCNHLHANRQALNMLTSPAHQMGQGQIINLF